MKFAECASAVAVLLALTSAVQTEAACFYNEGTEGPVTIYAFPPGAETWKAVVNQGDNACCNYGDRSCWPVDISQFTGQVSTGAIDPNTATQISVGKIE